MSNITIKVSDPTKCNDRFSTYISYKVTTTLSVPLRPKSSNEIHKWAHLDAVGITVVRRFSDFVWLSEQLSNEYPGAIIPSLPDKQAIGRFSPEFVETRRRALERFLVKVSTHPELSDSSHFIMFLEGDDTALGSAKETSAAFKKRLSNTAYSWFGDTVNNLSNSSRGNAGGIGDLHEKSPADIKIHEISLYIWALEKQMQNVARHSEFLVKRSRETATAMFELSQSLTYLGQSEGDTLGAALTQVGATVANLEKTATTHAELESTELEEPFAEYVRLITSVKIAIQQRQEKKNLYTNATLDLEAKQAAFSKVEGVPGKEDQVIAKGALVEKAKATAEAARNELEVVSNRLLSEFEAFKQQKAIEIRSTLLSFVTLQIEYNRKHEKAWGDLVPALQVIASQSPEVTSDGVGDGGFISQLHHSSYPSARVPYNDTEEEA